MQLPVQSPCLWRGAMVKWVRVSGLLKEARGVKRHQRTTRSFRTCGSTLARHASRWHSKWQSKFATCEGKSPGQASLRGAPHGVVYGVGKWLRVSCLLSSRREAVLRVHMD